MIKIHQFCKKAGEKDDGSFWPMGLDAARTADTLRKIANEIEKPTGSRMHLSKVQIDCEATVNDLATFTLSLLFLAHVDAIAATGAPDEPGARLPLSAFARCKWAGTTNRGHDAVGQGLFGISFESDDERMLRLAIDDASAWHLSTTLREYLEENKVPRPGRSA